MNRNPNPERPCTECSRKCRSRTRLCSLCRGLSASTRVRKLTYADTLVGGKWVQQGAIKVWKAWDAA